MNTPSPIAATNGWTFVKSDVNYGDRTNHLDVVPPFAKSSIETRKQRRHSSETFVQSIPFCDYLVVGGE